MLRRVRVLSLRTVAVVGALLVATSLAPASAAAADASSQAEKATSSGSSSRAAASSTKPADPDVGIQAVTCAVFRNNPMTFASVRCKKGSIFDRAELYAAYVRCVDRRINVQYTVIGTIYRTPALGGWGPWSTASCDPGDRAIEGGRT
jgi:hypothetical protein